MNFRHALAIAMLCAGGAASAQAVDVKAFGTPRTDIAPPILNARVAFDPVRPGVPFNGQVSDFTPIDAGYLNFGGDGVYSGPARSFSAEQLSYTYSAVGDSLGIRVRVNPEALGAGESAELLFGNGEGNRLTFPSYTGGPGGFTTSLFRYTLGGVSNSFQTRLIDNRGAAVAVPEPAPVALFAMALLVLLVARRYARPPAAPAE